MFGEDSRGRLLRATAIVVGRKGTQNCTVQNILDQANLSRRTFYKAFSNIEEALDSLFEVATNLLRREIEEVMLADVEAAQAIIDAVNAYLHLQLVGGRLIIVLQEESRRPESLLAPRRKQLVDRFVELLQRTVESQTGEERDPLVYRSFVLMMEGLVLDQQSDGPLNKDKVRRIKKVTLHTLFSTVEFDTSLID